MQQKAICNFALKRVINLQPSRSYSKSLAHQQVRLHQKILHQVAAVVILIKAVVQKTFLHHLIVVVRKTVFQEKPGIKTLVVGLNFSHLLELDLFLHQKQMLFQKHQGGKLLMNIVQAIGILLS